MSEGDDGLFVSFLVVALHLHALAEVHETLVDLAGFCEGGTSSLCLTGAFGACNNVSECKAKKLEATYQPSQLR